MKCYDVIVIGAGAAGLFCAGRLAEAGKKVAIFESNERPGKKILVSGGGRCNFTNLKVTPRDFFTSEKKFPQYALKQYPSSRFIDLVKKNNIDFYEKKLGQLFCKSKSEEILSMLLKSCRQGGVAEFYEQKDIKIRKTGEGYDVVSTTHSGMCANVVVATGGLSFPALGASPFGHEIAKQFGHKVVPAFPALVGLKWDGLPDLAGISVVAQVRLDKFSVTEDVLITHRGLSGPAILKASLYWSPGDKIRINWVPETNLVEWFSSQKQKGPNKKLGNVLSMILPQKLAAHFISEVGLVGNKSLQEISKKELNRLAEYISNMTVEPTSTEGFRRAEVTRGGVDCSQVEAKTMESKLSKGLYFIGEVLDVTGQLGGYNFQWAWSSAWVAAESLINGVE